MAGMCRGYTGDIGGTFQRYGRDIHQIFTWEVHGISWAMQWISSYMPGICWVYARIMLGVCLGYIQKYLNFKL